MIKSKTLAGSRVMSAVSNRLNWASSSEDING